MGFLAEIFMNNGFLKSTQGNMSSTRLYGGLIILYGMLMGFLVLFLGYLMKESILALAPIAAVTFSSIAGPAMIFLFQQKKKEVEKSDNQK